MNMTTAKGYITGKSTVSVPELMHENGLNYASARGIVSVLEKAGAIRYRDGVTYACIEKDESNKTAVEKKSNVSRANPSGKVGGANALIRKKAIEKINQAYENIRKATVTASDLTALVYSKIRKLPNTRVEHSEGKLLIYPDNIYGEKICIEFWCNDGYRYVFRDKYDKINRKIESSDIKTLTLIKGIAENYGVTLMANYMYKEVHDASEIVAHFLNMQIAIEEILRLNN